MTSDKPGDRWPGWTLKGVFILLAVLVAVLLSVLTMASAANPHLNIPIISKTVCSIRGDVWFEEPNAWYGVTRPGCYRAPTHAPIPIPTPSTEGP